MSSCGSPLCLVPEAMASDHKHRWAVGRAGGSGTDYDAAHGNGAGAAERISGSHGGKDGRSTFRVHTAPNALMRPWHNDVMNNSYIAALFAVFCVGIMPAVTSAEAYGTPFIASWTPFYKHMNIQGNYIKSTTTSPFLATIPAYLSDPSLDFPYKPRSSAMREIPYVAQFAVSRAVGGYSQKMVDAVLGAGKPKNALDLVTYDPATKGYVYHFALLTDGLRRFIDVGYAPKDIILDLDNIPWDLSTNKCPDGSAAGDWGNRSIIKDYAEYRKFMVAFATQLKDTYGSRANDFRFKVGAEFNNDESYCGTTADYVKWYTTTASAIRSVLPTARIMPFEHAGQVTLGAVNTQQVYKSLYAANADVAATPISLHSIGVRTISSLIDNATSRYSQIYDGNQALMKQAPPEIHQFGILSTAAFPSFSSAYTESGIRSASWYFQMIMNLKERLGFRTISHWQLYDEVPTNQGESVFLSTPPSLLYQILDGLVGSKVFKAKLVLSVETGIEAYGAAFKRGDETVVVISTYAAHDAQGASPRIAAHLPMAAMPGGELEVREIVLSNSMAPATYLKNMVYAGQVPGVRLKKPFDTNTRLMGAMRQMIESSEGGTVSVALRLLGDTIAASSTVSAQLRSLSQKALRFGPSNAALIKQANGEYLLSSGAYGPDAIKIFSIRPKAAAQPVPAVSKPTVSPVPTGSSTAVTSVSTQPSVAKAPVVVRSNPPVSSANGLLRSNVSRCDTDTLCSATISWKTSEVVQIWVTVQGSPQSRLFACVGKDGSKDLDWLVKDHWYVFKMHPAADCDTPSNTRPAKASLILQ